MLQQPAETEHVSLFGIEVDPITIDDAVARLSDWASRDHGMCRYVVTPNVDHLVMLRHDSSFQSAYDEAAMIVADGWPLVAASRLLGKRIPTRVAGSDLVPALFSHANDRHPLRVFLLGAAPGVADRAATRVEHAWPNVSVTGTHCPPLGFEHEPRENELILNRIADTETDVLIIGLGAPKQELWIHAHHRSVQARVAICAGATIDFLAGEKKRAPRWVRRLGLEWCHRMFSEPRRLTRRYARDAWVFPQLVWSEWIKSRP